MKPLRISARAPSERRSTVSAHELLDRPKTDCFPTGLNHYDRARPWYVLVFVTSTSLIVRLASTARASESQNATRSCSLYLLPCLPIFVADAVPPHSFRDISDFLNKKPVQYRLGVDPAIRGQTFNWSSHAVNQAFHANLDMFSFPAHYYIAALLERGIRALIYVGATDYICNWVRLPPPLALFLL